MVLKNSQFLVLSYLPFAFQLKRYEPNELNKRYKLKMFFPITIHSFHFRACCTNLKFALRHAQGERSMC